MANTKITAANIDSTSTGFTLADLTVDTTTLVVDASNNRVGIGTTSPEYQLDVQGAGNSRIKIKNTSVTGDAQFHHDGNGDLYIKNSVSGRNQIFFNNGAEAMRIDSSGNVLINGTSKFNGYPSGFVTQSIASDSGDLCPILELAGNRNASAGNQNAMIQFYNKTSTATEVSRISSIQGSATNSGELQFHIASGGTLAEAMRIDASGMLLVNTQSSWGGETTPHIESRGDVAGDYTGLIVSNTNDAAGDSVSVNFGLARDGGLVFGNAGKITVGKEQDWTSTPSTVDGFMSFSTMQNESLTERVRITSSGGLEVGDGTNYGYLKVISNNAVTGYFDRRNSDGTVLEFRKDDSNYGIIGIATGGIWIGAGQSNYANIRFTNDQVHPCSSSGGANNGNINLGKSTSKFKDLYLSGNVRVDSGQGILFGGAAGNSGMSSQVLDDYEEGTFTATLENTGTSPAPTANGSYTKIGRQVTIHIYFAASSSITSAGNCRISGLPFSASAINNSYGMVFYTHGNVVADNKGSGYISGTNIDIIAEGSTGYTQWNTGSRYGMWTGIYQTA